MFRQALRRIYKAFPFILRFLGRDLYLYLKARIKGAVPVSELKIEKNFNDVAVVGNGPSLRLDKNNFSILKDSHDFICVNNFCDDRLYTVIKPKVYVFLDAYFFSENAHSDWIERREKTFSIINEKTEWPMKIIVPHYADEKILTKSIQNENVKIIKIATQGLPCKEYNDLLGKVFDMGIYGPPQINVLIYGIYIGIILGYEKVNVYGADLSFHKDISVDQNTNDLYITFKHFNEKDNIEVLRKNPDKVMKWRMAELLQLSADTFSAHELMSDYAKYKGVSILNKSSQSLIDAYPRNE
ncbi:hypothetical protein [Marinobacter apostichopi]|uniref:hypothetical protein n=1 Tax=Marinobacter apostichopi TaxID=3035454 RepID=UPI00257359F8|nr:hypothetical protein [Marinobacter sp. LA51]